jgi:FMN phosphatase YigB (HAD superfamily)
MSARAVLVFDLDGTLYRGIAACLHYAEGIAETLDPDARAGYLEAVEWFLQAGEGVDAADGWEAAVLLAGGAPGASRAFAEPFARTRAFMLTDACELEVPDGLVELLERSAGMARRILVSNTPSFGVMPLLNRLGLAERLDEIVCDAAKPHRFAERLRAYADVEEVLPRAVLSIGDHFVNDIAPALEAGCSTAYVNPFGVGPRGRADLEAPRLEDLLGALDDWLRDSAGVAA